jgi:porin
VPWRFGSVALDGRLWANATYGLRSGVQEVPNTYAAGWIGKGVIRTRPHDALVLGVTNANWNRRIQGGPIWETAMELGYQLALGSNATLQPSAQYIFNPMGRGEVDDALVLGLQLNVSF